jgi:hypothetical protein
MFFKSINNVLKWEPYHIFHTVEYKWYAYDKPQVEGDLFGISTKSGTTVDIYHHTKLGKFMNKLPLLLELFLKGCYYLPTWILYLIIKIFWFLFKFIFIPQHWVN